MRGVVIVAFILWSATQLDGFSWDYDEGVHVYIAWLVQQGHTLYTQTFSPYTPGYILPLVAAFRLFGATVFVARLVTVLCATLGLLGVMLSAGELARAENRSSLFAELAAAALLIAAPSFYQWSRAAMSDLPAAAVATFAVALALRYARASRWRYLWAAQMVLALALWMKLIAIGSAAPMALIMLQVGWSRRAAWRQLIVVTVSVIGLALLPLLAFDLRGLYEQAIYFHVQKRAAYEFSLAENWQILFDFLGSQLSLLSLVIGYWLLTISYRQARLYPISNTKAPFHHLHLPITNDPLLITSFWFVATFITLLFQTPLFANHHPVVLVFPLAALAGASLVKVMSNWRLVITFRPFTVSPLHLITLSLIVGAVCVDAQTFGERWQSAARPAFQPVAAEALTLTQAVTPPHDLLVSDGIMLAFRAQRSTPPALSDVSNARLRSGNLTAEQLIAITQQSQANGVLFWSGRLESAPAFVKWTEQNYYPVRSSFQKPNSPYRLLLREPHPQYPLDVRIGEGMRLWGYDLQRRESAPIVAGQTLSLTLYFQRIGAVERAYTVFAHLVNTDGQIIAQADRPPFAGRYPTDQWRMNEWLVDEFVFTLQPALLAGAYTIALGMYQGDTRAPLTRAGVRLADDRLVLPAVSVRAK
jgi:4-amino-4-deoxy-L-arabinose transferase-like glycosyltransferase